MEFTLFQFRTNIGPVLGVAVMLGGCAGTPGSTTTTVTDATLALSEGEAILAALVADGTIPAKAQADATLLIDALKAAIAAFGGQAAGAGTAPQVLAEARAAVSQLMADSADPLVRQAGTLALAAIDAVAATTTNDAQTQVLAALGAMLIDEMAALAPAASHAAAARAAADR